MDILFQINILQLVKKLNQEFGITIIMVLHDINQAIAYSDNVIGMKDGKMLVEGDPEEVITEESIRELYGIELGVTRVDGQKFVLAVEEGKVTKTIKKKGRAATRPFSLYGR